MLALFFFCTGFSSDEDDSSPEEADKGEAAG